MFKPQHQVGRQSSYWSRPEFQTALNSSADFIVLMLGTNDARADRWSNFSNFFSSDYADMLNAFAAMPSKPVILIMVPPPLYKDGRYGMNQTVINSIFPSSTSYGIREIAKTARLSPPIDVYSLFQKHCPVVAGTPGYPPNATDQQCDWIGSGGSDGCHPSDEGYKQIASAVKDAILHYKRR